MNKRWQDMVILFLGFWLVVSPFILPRTMGDFKLFNNSLIVGALLTVVAIAAIIRPNAWIEFALVALASWLMAASYLFGNGVLISGSLTTLAGNQLIVGLLVMAAAAFGLYRRKAIRDMSNKPGAPLTSGK